MKPQYTLKDIKLKVDETTFARAAKLYESGAVGPISQGVKGYAATVKGTELYQVWLSPKDVYLADCNCYVGQNDTLCKHMVALALAVLAGNDGPFETEDLQQNNTVEGSGKVGVLSADETAVYRKEISTIITKYIRSYDGPSRTWFTYQNRLDEGCNRLADVVRRLPICTASADLMITMLLRLDTKLSSGGVDDSNGTVGGFIERCVIILETQARQDEGYIAVFRKRLPTSHTCFDWELPLMELVNSVDRRDVTEL